MNEYVQRPAAGQYVTVNGLPLYYELHGSGNPLVLLHGGGSTIRSSFGQILPRLARKYRVVAVELQAHGHTPDRDQPLSFEQDADDVAALLDHLGMDHAAILGFSNGGTTALQVAIRHPARVAKLVLASALCKRDGVAPAFWEGFAHATLAHMPAQLQQAYLEAHPDPAGLQRMFDRDVARMKDFRDIADDAIRSVSAPALIVSSDQDVILPEHSVALFRLLPAAELIILPGYHGQWMDAAEAGMANNYLPALALPMIEQFLDKA